jgi:hypothetical protein
MLHIYGRSFAVDMLEPEKQSLGGAAQMMSPHSRKVFAESCAKRMVRRSHSRKRGVATLGGAQAAAAFQPAPQHGLVYFEDLEPVIKQPSGKNYDLSDCQRYISGHQCLFESFLGWRRKDTKPRRKRPIIWRESSTVHGPNQYQG